MHHAINLYVIVSYNNIGAMFSFRVVLHWPVTNYTRSQVSRFISVCAVCMYIIYIILYLCSLCVG